MAEKKQAKAKQPAATKAKHKDEKSEPIVVPLGSKPEEMNEKHGEGKWRYADDSQPKPEPVPVTVTSKEVAASDQPKAPEAPIEIKD